MPWDRPTMRAASESRSRACFATGSWSPTSSRGDQRKPVKRCSRPSASWGRIAVTPTTTRCRRAAHRRVPLHAVPKFCGFALVRRLSLSARSAPLQRSRKVSLRQLVVLKPGVAGRAHDVGAVTRQVQRRRGHGRSQGADDQLPRMNRLARPSKKTWPCLSRSSGAFDREDLRACTFPIRKSEFAVITS